MDRPCDIDILNIGQIDMFMNFTCEDVLKQPLYEYQKKIVGAVLKLESRRHRIMRGNKYYSSHACLLADMFGSGKSIIILAIMASRDPYIYERYYIGNSLRQNSRNYIIMAPSKIININIIVLSECMIEQWQQYISEFTNFTYMVINNINTFKLFIKYMAAKQLPDIVLIKNGHITSKVSAVLSVNKKIDTILGAMHCLLGDSFAKWVIYDDYDIIEKAPNVPLINGLYTIFVSATETPINARISETNILDTYTCQISRDKIFKKHFKIACRPEYINQCLSVPACKYFLLIYENQDNSWISLLNKLNTNYAAEVAEHINAGALDTLTKNLGIQATSVSEIFQKILNNTYDIYRDALIKIKRLDGARQYIDSLPRADGPPAVDNLREAIFNGEYSDMINNDATQQFISELADTYTEIMNTNAKAIDRVKSNLESGECMICCLPLEDIVITKCCGIVVCGMCIKSGFKLGVHKNVVHGTCAHCSKELIAATGLIYITPELKNDFDALIEDHSSIALEEKSNSTSHNAEDMMTMTASLQDKCRDLIKIITSNSPTNIIGDEIDAPRMSAAIIGSNNFVNKPINAPRKIIIFASFDETLVKISSILELKNIKVFIMKRFAAKLLDEFRKYNNPAVLLINSREICAGLNIQFASDLIFFHRPPSQIVEAQIIGRIQRIGREYSANVYYLYHKNEILY